MHHYLINDASEQDLKNYLIGEFDRLKTSYPKLYEEMEDDLYLKLNGCHFNEYLYNRVISNLENSDGTIGGHWQKNQIIDYAKSKGLEFKNFNEWDFAYVMNIMYSDYFGAVIDSTETYFKLAKAFLQDKDAPCGKAYLYYRAMKNR